jgi:DNA repair protein RecN (Recombination protein N)
VQQASQDLTDGDGSVDQLLGHAVKRLGQASGLDPSLEGLVKQVEEARLSLQDAGYRLSRYRDGLQFEPHRAEAIEDRLALITRLKRKYGEDEAGIAARGATLKAELDSMNDEEAWLDSLTGDVDRAGAATLAAGKMLRAWRADAARKLEKGVGLELSALGMPRARLHVRMEAIIDPVGGLLDDEDGHAVGIAEKGIDRVEFFLEANPGEEARPLARVASGGELSRIMLALKAVLRSADPLPILIFDEVDAGIGGRVATEVGKRLHEIAGGRQVFVITHLPMIACQADHHFRVVKSIEKGRTATNVTAISGREREKELARMLAGSNEAPEALQAARALLDQARKGSR